MASPKTEPKAATRVFVGQKSKNATILMPYSTRIKQVDRVESEPATSASHIALPFASCRLSPSVLHSRASFIIPLLQNCV
jgi:hypothetical protein